MDRHRIECRLHNPNCFFIHVLYKSKNEFLAILLMIAIFYFTTQLWIKTMPLFRKMMFLVGRVEPYVQQNVISMKGVRIFQREQEMEEDFKQVEEIYVNTAISAGKIQSKYMPSGFGDC